MPPRRRPAFRPCLCQAKPSRQAKYPCESPPSAISPKAKQRSVSKSEFSFATIENPSASILWLDRRRRSVLPFEEGLVTSHVHELRSPASARLYLVSLSQPPLQPPQPERQADGQNQIDIGDNGI